MVKSNIIFQKQNSVGIMSNQVETIQRIGYSINSTALLACKDQQKIFLCTFLFSLIGNKIALSSEYTAVHERDEVFPGILLN